MRSTLLVMLIGLLQATPPPTASIEGIVVRTGTTDPVPGAYVEASRDGSVSSATADDAGRFRIPDLQPGDYALVATLSGSGLMPALYGQRNPKGRPLTFTLNPGQQLSDVRLSMASTGTISGRVYDRDGDPVANARVLALQPIYKDGHRALTTIAAVKTDDLGEYRLFWLPPARYMIGVQSEDLRTNTFSVLINSPERSGTREDATSPTIIRRTLDDGRIIEETDVMVYFGGGRDFDKARAIDVPPGGNVGAIDVPLNDARMPAYRIRGVVVNGSNGQPVAGATIRLIPRTPGPHVIIPNGVTDKQGAFNIGGAIAGSYLLFATTNAGRGGGATETYYDASIGLSGMLPLEISDRDANNVTVMIKPGIDIPGRIVVDGNMDMTPVRVALTRTPDIIGMPGSNPGFVFGNGTPGQRPTGTPLPDGTFTMNGFGIGDYRVIVTGIPQNAYIKSIRLADIEVSSTGVHIDNGSQGQMDISISLNSATVDGTAMNDKQEPFANATVVLVPEQGLRQRPDLYKTVTTNGTGHFHIQGVAPGEYKVFAWDSVERDAWQDPEFIRGFENRGTAVRVNAGGKESIQVAVIP